MNHFNTPSEYYIHLATNQIKISRIEFFKNVHSMFYSEYDISFMDYFIELIKHDGKHVVEHKKLNEYGIMTSTKPSDAKDRFNALGFEEGKDYVVKNNSRDIPRVNIRGPKPLMYMLTPKAFKICLMCARCYAGHVANSQTYSEYYLLLEKVNTYFDDYEKEYKNVYYNNIINDKEDKINELIIMTREQSNKLDNQTKVMNGQSDEIKQLLAYGKQTTEKLDITNYKLDTLNTKFDILFDFVIDFARITLPMWVGSNVSKAQYETLLNERTEEYALSHMKIAFVLGFYNENKLKIYFCCTNLLNVSTRIKKLSEFHLTNRNRMYMMEPKAITLMSSEVNSEIASINTINLQLDNVECNFITRSKAFDITTMDVNNTYNLMVEHIRNYKFQPYQRRMDEVLNTNEIEFNQDVIDYVVSTDKRFFDKTLPFIQLYLMCYVNQRNIDNVNEYVYRKASITKSIRNDLNNTNVSDRMYVMMKIRSITYDEADNDTIDQMVHDGIITKNDIEALRKIAEVENVDVSHVEIPDEMDE